MQKFFNAIIEEAERQIDKSTKKVQNLKNPKYLIRKKPKLKNFTIVTIESENELKEAELRELPEVKGKGKDYDELYDNLQAALDRYIDNLKLLDSGK